MKTLSMLANMCSILGVIGLIFTVYSLTIESYSKRNSAIFLQARILNEQVLDVIYQGMTDRQTIDMVEIYKLEALLMEKPILTTIFYPKYNKLEKIYQEKLREFKENILNYNTYRTKMIQVEKKNPNLDNSESLEYKMNLLKNTSDILKISEKLENKEKNQ